MKFKTRVGTVYILIVVACTTLFGGHLLWYVFYSWSTVGFIINATVLVVLAILFGSIWKTTYELTDTHLIYKMGFVSGKIEIDRIREIVVGKNMHTGFKPAAALKGLTIKYGKYEDIYISPQTNEAFIAEILKINPDINIVR